MHVQVELRDVHLAAAATLAAPREELQEARRILEAVPLDGEDLGVAEDTVLWSQVQVESEQGAFVDGRLRGGGVGALLDIPEWDTFRIGFKKPEGNSLHRILILICTYIQSYSLKWNICIIRGFVTLDSGREKFLT